MGQTLKKIADFRVKDVHCKSTCCLKVENSYVIHKCSKCNSLYKVYSRSEFQPDEEKKIN
jgi:hypothetical protein